MNQDSSEITEDGIIKTKIDYSSPFFEAVTRFTKETFLLRELNKELPESIDRIKKKSDKDIRKRYQSLDAESRKRLDADMQAFMDLFTETKSLPREEMIRRARSTLKMTEAESAFIWDLMCGVIFPPRFDDFIRNMSLVYLVAEFESFLGNLLRISFERKPEILASSQKTVTYEEVVKLGRIDYVKERIAEREIFSAVNQNIDDIERYFEVKLKVILSSFCGWKEFKERFYRRNILVHNSGMPNELYRSKTGHKGKDERLTVSQQYLKESIKLFEGVGLRIAEKLYDKFELKK